jgi:hypothetical protein
LGHLLLLAIALFTSRATAQPLAAHVEPAAVTVALGSSQTFCAVTTGDGVFSYQWQKNGINLPGQTNECLAITNVTVGDGGSYRATVFNAGGAVESEEGVLTLTIIILPGRDEFTNAASIMAVSNSVRGASFSATREAAEPGYRGLNTSNSVWYSWRAPGTGIVTFDTRGSAIDTVLAVFTGNSLNTLVEIASDDDSGGFHSSSVSWNAVAGTDYRVLIDGVTGETGNYVCNWNLEITNAHLPVFSLKPRSQTVPPGGTAIFRTAVIDTDPYLMFQWYQNGQRIVGATSSNLNITGVQSVHLGQYQLAVTNISGRGVLSPPVVLEIGPDPTVQSRDKVAEIPISGGGGPGGFIPAGASAGTFSLSAGTIINQRFANTATMDRCEPAHCGVPGGASRWFQVSAMSDGVCTLDTANSDVDTVLAVYVQNFAICTNLFEPLVDCNNDAVGSCDQILGPNGRRDRSSRVSFFATAGTIYRAVVDTAGGARGTNLQFNVHFESTASVPSNNVQLAAGTNCLLQLRGSTVTLQVASNFVTAGNTYQWRFNGRRIAGATRDRLVLPLLNYSDAARYSVLVQNGTSNLLLPGATVLVIDPCHETAGGSSAGTSNAAFPMVGSTPELIALESTGTLNATSSWQMIGPIPASTDPTLWDVGIGSSRFYRAVRPPP